MLTTLMNEGANKWRNDKKRTYFLIDEAKNSATIPICGKEQNMGARKIMVAD